MNPSFLAGVRRALPVILSAAPFGLLFGALAVDNGLTVFQAALMSATVYAGASQMVGIELFARSRAGMADRVFDLCGEPAAHALFGDDGAAFWRVFGASEGGGVLLSD